MEYINNYDYNITTQQIIEMLNNNIPFSIVRVRTEDKVIYKIINNQKLDNYDYTLMYYNCGVYPQYDIDIIKKFVDEYIDAYKNSNVFCYAAHVPIYSVKYVIDTIDNKNIFLGNGNYYAGFIKIFKNYILNKKILFISSMIDTMKMAYDTGKLAVSAFKNVEFYRCKQSIAGNGTDTNWYDSLNIMINDISKLDFDIAFISAGGYATPLCNHIKKMGKQAVNVGGDMQLWFSINGKRWNKRGLRYNFNVLEHEIPKNIFMVEGGCYW